MTLYGPPAASPIQLAHRPQVLSWDAAGSWPQERLRPYRQEIAASFAGVEGDNLSFRLSCGLGPTASLEAAGDLDNLLVPVIDALGRSRFVGAWGAKDARAASTLAVGPPTRIDPATLAAWHHVAVHTKASAGTEAWKQEIAAQLVACTPIPPSDAVAMVIAFTVGAGRAWPNLWKPAIDATGQILGVPGPRRWHPRDCRIVELGLSVEVDPSLGWDILLRYWWQARNW